MKTKVLSRFLFASVLLFDCGAVFAQEVPLEEIQAPERKTKAQAEAQEAAEESERLPEKEGEATYEQVLAHPDDIDLNYRYARTQVDQGNLRGASATLERILLVNPDLPKVRLLYAIVLFRLDNMQESERELKALKGLEMPESLRKDIDEYLKEIGRRKKRTRLSARLGIGSDYDTNRNSSPSSQERLFGDVPLSLSGSELAEGDFSLVTIAGLDIDHDLGTQAGHRLFGSLGYFRTDQMDLGELSLQAVSVRAGLVYRTRFGDVTPTAVFDHLLLARETFLRTEGGTLKFERRISSRLNAFLEGGLIYQDYAPTSSLPTAEDREGRQYSFTLGGDYALKASQKIFAGFTHSDQNANAKFFAYRRESFTGSHAWLLGKGRFLLTSGTFNWDLYVKPDTAVSARTREDKTIRTRLTYGLPLALISERLGAILLTAAYEYYHAFSNVTNYQYNNHKVSTMFTYKWER